MKWFSLRSGFILLLLIAALHGGWVWFLYETKSWPATEMNRPLLLDGEISSLPQAQNHAWRFIFTTAQGKVRLNAYPPFPDVEPGEHWRLWVKLKPIEFMGNPGEFDEALYLKHQGILASGYVLTHPPPLLLGSHPWQAPIEYMRFQVYQKVLQATAGLPMQGILLALLFGDKTQVNPVQMHVFEATGTSYFMVISGLHIVLFAWMGALLMRYLWGLFPRATLRVPAQQIGLLTGLLLGVIYSLLAGFVVPTQRAVWMIGLLGLARLALLPFHSLQTLVLAGLLVVAWNPFVLYSIAFWMSFVAVFFLIYRLRGRKHTPGWRKIMHEWLYPQWVMYIALMPMIIYCFQNFSFFSIFSNIVAVPFMIIAVIPLALLGAVLLWIVPVVGQLLLAWSNQVMSLLWVILQHCAELPHWSWTFAAPHFGGYLLAQAGAVMLLAPRGWPLRWFGSFLFLPLLWPGPVIDPGQFQATVLHLEAGKAVILATSAHTIVLQESPQLKRAKADIAYIIKPALLYLGRTHVDVWVINFDGTEASFLALENAWVPLTVGQIITNQDYHLFDSKRHRCEPAWHQVLDGLQFDVTQNGKACWARLASLS